MQSDLQLLVNCMDRTLTRAAAFVPLSRCRCLANGVIDPSGFFHIQDESNPPARFAQLSFFQDGLQHPFTLFPENQGQNHFFFRLNRNTEEFCLFMNAGTPAVNNGASLHRRRFNRQP